MHESSQAASPALLRRFCDVQDSYEELARRTAECRSCNRHPEQANSVRHAADYGVMRDPVYVDISAAESFNNLIAPLNSESIRRERIR